MEWNGSYFKASFNRDRGLSIWRMPGSRDGKETILLKNVAWAMRDKHHGLVIGAGAGASEGVEYDVAMTKHEGATGTGTRLEIRSRHDGLDIIFIERVVFHDDEPSFMISLDIINESDNPLDVVEVIPAFSSMEMDGGLFLAGDLHALRVLEAGLSGALDLNVRCVFGDEESDSNGNVLYHDLEGGKNLIVGVLERPSAMVQVISNEDGEEGIRDSASGLCSFHDWKVVKGIVPFKRVPPADAISSHTIYFYMDGYRNAHEHLEHYASMLARNIGIRPWPTDRCVPHGWNSWGNPSKDDPVDENGQNLAVLVHDLTEENCIENFEIARDRLQRFGLEYFQLDDGYQEAHGDWLPRRDRFPRGLEPVFRRVRDAGMKPGIWIRPFEASVNSKLVKEHPDWVVGWEDSFPMKSRNILPLDLTRHDVQQYLAAVFRRFRHLHGLAWIKTDFTYNLLGGKGFQDESKTAIEVFQDGFKLIRDVMGGDTFIVGIGGPCQLHYGLVDAERVTLDVHTSWGVDGEMMPIEPGIKVNARIIARRYYLHGRVWLTHCDVLQFRAPLTREMSLVQATVMGLAGGVFKVGEKFTNLTDEQFDVVSKLLPVYRPRSRGMRPVDLLIREYPEVWDLLVDDRGNGLGAYHVVGAFNWDGNRELDREIPPGPRTIEVDLVEIGLRPGTPYLVFEFWGARFLGIARDKFSVEVEPRSVALLVFRELHEHPQFLSSRRHITQGAIDVISIHWDEGRRDLVLRARVVPRHRHDYYFHVPGGFALDSIETTLGTPSKVVEGPMLKVFLEVGDIDVPGNGSDDSGDAGGQVVITLHFRET